MAIPSSPAAIGLQQSIPPPPQSGSSSAHEPSIPRPTGRSSMSSSVGQRQIQPPRRSPALVGSPQQQTADRQVASNQAGGEVSSAVANSKRRYHFWTDKDDTLLMAAIKRHGTQWEKVKEFIDEGGGTSRLAASLPQRYRLLVRRKKEGIQRRGSGSVSRDTALSSASKPTGSNAPGQFDLPKGAASGEAGPSTPHKRHADYQLWTEPEVQKILSIPRSTSTRFVFPAFRAAFPSTTRTKGGVVAKWCRVHDSGRSVQVDDSGSVGEEGLELEEQSSAWEDQPSLMPDEGQAVGASSAILHGPQPQPAEGAREVRHEPSSTSAAATSTPQDIARQSEAAPFPLALDSTPLQQTRLCLEAAQSATGPTSSADVINTQDQASSAPSLHPQRPSQSHAISYFVSRTPNGFLITDFPPGYKLLILTPTRCQVVGPDEQVLAQPEAPFAFTVKSDGDVEAINLPVGTEITREVVEPEHRHLSLDRQARVKITFTAVDDYTVCFEGHAALEL